MIIYVIVNSETLKIYIGQHKGDDLQHYLQQKWYESRKRQVVRSHLYAALRKHPRASWSIHPLLSTTCKVELDTLERHFIHVLNAQHPEVGYNICDGGEGFTGPHTDESKRKISAALLGHLVSADTRKKISKAVSLAQKGKKRPPSPKRLEQLRKQMAGNTFCVGRQNIHPPLTPSHNLKLQEGHARAVNTKGNWWLGRKHSDATKQKIRDARRLRLSLS